MTLTKKDFLKIAEIHCTEILDETEKPAQAKEVGYMITNMIRERVE